ncbi:hypothetical protein CF165_46555 [Amycolatopsis vastitatis]|uniref:Uncharacterized protein n=1 Tax=Amycolatopsis vastitatis TaxID=1905142 RepID=A0A229SLY0_9PSEU|nr:hypothetical protein CF165_46555 [Amycolatopsis vastitatis]
MGRSVLLQGQRQIVSMDEALHALSVLVTARRQGYLRVPPGRPDAQLSVSGRQPLGWLNRRPHRPRFRFPLRGRDAGTNTAGASSGAVNAGGQA